MNFLSSARAIALLSALLTISSTASAHGFGELIGPGARIVGAWSTEALVGPCNATPGQPVRNTLLFHAGGTLIDVPRFGPNGVPNVLGIPGIYQRGQGLGTWTYNPFNRRFYIHLQFDNYVDNIYHGYSTVDREITLSNGGMLATGPVTSSRYKADGTLISEVCGHATSTPL